MRERDATQLSVATTEGATKRQSRRVVVVVVVGVAVGAGVAQMSRGVRRQPSARRSSSSSSRRRATLHTRVSVCVCVRDISCCRMSQKKREDEKKSESTARKPEQFKKQQNKKKKNLKAKMKDAITGWGKIANILMGIYNLKISVNISIKI